MTSQKEHYKKIKNRLNVLQKDIDAIQTELDWFNDQLNEFKDIEPGCNNATNLKRRLQAWRTIVPGCDTPQKLKDYIKKLERQRQMNDISEVIPDGLARYEYWNDFFVPYCQKNNIDTFRLSEAEYIAEETYFLDDLQSYGEADDPYNFKLFFKFLRDKNIVIPSIVEMVL